jgi:hypothetical protein
MFDEKLKYAMDIDLWLRLGQVARPATIDRPLTVFRDHAGSVSSANKIKARQEEFQVRRRYMKQAPLAFGIYCLRYMKAHAGTARGGPCRRAGVVEVNLWYSIKFAGIALIVSKLVFSVKKRLGI